MPAAASLNARVKPLSAAWSREAAMCVPSGAATVPFPGRAVSFATRTSDGLLSRSCG